MRNADIITASVLTALGILVLAEAVRLGFRWGPDGPQSGFFPFWLAVILNTPPAERAGSITYTLLRHGVGVNRSHSPTA